MSEQSRSKDEDLVTQVLAPLRSVQPARLVTQSSQVAPQHNRVGRTVFVVALALGTLIGVLIVSSLSTDGPTTAATGRRENSVPGGLGQRIGTSRDKGPFALGQKVSLGEAEKLAGFALIRPNSTLANDSIIRAVFIEVAPDPEAGALSTQVAIDYESGIVIQFEPAAYAGFDVDSRAQYEAMLEGAQTEARVQTVDGVPALVVPPGTDALGTNPAYVDLTLEGVRISISSSYAPLSEKDLIAVAETLKQVSR